MKIFISYSHKDSAAVLPFANELIRLYGANSILIDEYIIRPGDSLIGFMNESLETFSHFVFFISNNSLDSYMVSLEWKNALILCKDPSKKFIPIIVDSVRLPAILNDLNHINLYEIGFIQCLNKLKETISGVHTLHEQIDNLIASVSTEGNSIKLTIKCLVYTETNSSFCVLFEDCENISFVDFNPFNGSTKKITIDSKELTAVFMRLFAPLTKTSPFYITFKSDCPFKLYKVMHVEDIDGRLMGKPIRIEHI